MVLKFVHTLSHFWILRRIEQPTWRTTCFSNLRSTEVPGRRKMPTGVMKDFTSYLREQVVLEQVMSPSGGPVQTTSLLRHQGSASSSEFVWIPRRIHPRRTLPRRFLLRPLQRVCTQIVTDDSLRCIDCSVNAVHASVPLLVEPSPDRRLLCAGCATLLWLRRMLRPLTDTQYNSTCSGSTRWSSKGLLHPAPPMIGGAVGTAASVAVLVRTEFRQRGW